jgi:hypothetical protein
MSSAAANDASFTPMTTENMIALIGAFSTVNVVFGFLLSRFSKVPSPYYIVFDLIAGCVCAYLSYVGIVGTWVHMPFPVCMHVPCLVDTPHWD